MLNEHRNNGRDAHEKTDKDRSNDKETTIIVNGREKTVTTKNLTFDELVALAFDDPPTGDFICFTITYRKGRGNKPEGGLIEGESVKIKEGMIFNVTATDKS